MATIGCDWSTPNLITGWFIQFILNSHKIASFVLQMFFWMKLCINLFALSVQLPWTPFLFGHSFFFFFGCSLLCLACGFCSLLAEFIYFFPGLRPVVWPQPALTPPRPMFFLSSKVFLLTSMPLIPGVCEQFFLSFFRVVYSTSQSIFFEAAVHILYLRSAPWFHNHTDY